MSNTDSTYVRRSYKFRLYPNVNQTRELEIALETHRRLWNECLSISQMAWEQYSVRVGYFDCCRWFSSQKKNNPFYARLNTSSARRTMRRVENAFLAFFRRVKSGSKPGHPRFKGVNDSRSIVFVNGDGAKLDRGKLRIQHVGTIRVKLHRAVEGKVKTITLKREAGKWFAIFSCELPTVEVPENILPPIGIDVGLQSFLTTSNGNHEPNPRYLKTSLPELRVAQRSVSRKKKGGSNRRKAVVAVQKVHWRVANLRRSHHFQIAHKLILAYGLIAVEGLNIQVMVKSRRFSRAISDVAWGGFLGVLAHKAQKTGAIFVAVNPKGTSQECSGCGETVPKKLSDRQHDCPCCGLVLDRDVNAAKNILARGLARIGPAVVNVSA